MTIEWLPKYAWNGESLFVQDGKPPQPAWTPKGGRFGGDLRTVESYKMGRAFNLCWPLEWYHFVLLDLDPLVKWICERPAEIGAKVDGKKTSSTFDMWILWHDGREELREVKPLENVEAANRQISLQESWCKLICVDHRVVTENEVEKQPLLDNCLRMHPYLAQNPGFDWERNVLSHVDHASPFPLRKLVGASYLDTQKLWHAAVHLIWRGELIAPIETQPWEKLTLSRPTDDTRREPYC